jgi:hypothetical protein
MLCREPGHVWIELDDEGRKPSVSNGREGRVEDFPLGRLSDVVWRHLVADAHRLAAH